MKLEVKGVCFVRRVVFLSCETVGRLGWFLLEGHLDSDSIRVAAGDGVLVLGRGVVPGGVEQGVLEGAAPTTATMVVVVVRTVHGGNRLWIQSHWLWRGCL